MYYVCMYYVCRDVRMYECACVCVCKYVYTMYVCMYICTYVRNSSAQAVIRQLIVV